MALRALTEFYRRPWTLRRRLGWSLAAVNIIGTLIFSGLAYEASRSATLQSIDDTLCAAAEGARAIVPAMIPDQAEDPARAEPLYKDTYHAVQAELERYAAATKLVYIYSIVVRSDGTAYELVSNLSAAQRESGKDAMDIILHNPYAPSPGMVDTARTRVRHIDIALDNYGYFRSCYVPEPTTGGRVTVFGADMEISAVNKRLRRGLFINLSLGGLVLIVTLSVVRVISNGMAQDVRVVVNETEAVSRLAFTAEDKRLISSTLEVDQLFGALFDMKNGLKAFTKFVPTSVIKRVLAAGKAEIGGERRELSLLMTDVTDFTTISERLDPENVMTVMSEYFGNVVAPILEMHGTLDKYVGDAIFAYWNAPILQENHALLCCAAALKSRAASNQLADRWKAQGLWPWYTRFGLHAGETVFGNIGAPDRMDFTVIGSSVNLASRIEGLNKFYGTEILASDRIRDLAQDHFVFRSIDRVMPKGAIFDFMIYELLGTRESAEANAAAHDFLGRWEHAHALYRNRKWPEALAAFQVLAEAAPGDNVARIFVARCQKYVADPPPSAWDGIQHFESK